MSGAVAQSRHASKAEALEIAKKRSVGDDLTWAVICSQGEYWVERQPGLIRSWELLVAEFLNGEEIRRG